MILKYGSLALILSRLKWVANFFNQMLFGKIGNGKIVNRFLGKDHPDVATSLNNLAELYRVQGKYDQAEPLYQRSLAIREKTLGKDYPDVATSLNNSAVLYHAQGKYDQTEPLYQRSLAIMEKALGKNHPNTKTVKDNLQKLQARKN